MYISAAASHLAAQLLLLPRRAAAPPPPQLDGRGAQQVLYAAADRSASLRGHCAASCPVSSLSQRLELLSVAAAVILSARRAGQVRAARLWVRVVGWSGPRAPVPPPLRRHELRDRASRTYAATTRAISARLFKITPRGSQSDQNMSSSVSF